MLRFPDDTLTRSEYLKFEDLERCECGGLLRLVFESGGSRFEPPEKVLECTACGVEVETR